VDGYLALQTLNKVFEYNCTGDKVYDNCWDFFTTAGITYTVKGLAVGFFDGLLCQFLHGHSFCLFDDLLSCSKYLQSIDPSYSMEFDWQQPKNNKIFEQLTADSLKPEGCIRIPYSASVMPDNRPPHLVWFR